MQREKINKIWDHFKEGKASSEELALLESWYLNFEDTDRPDLTEEEVAARLAAVAAHLPLAKKTLKLWPVVGPNPTRRMAMVAAAVTAITLGIWLYYASSSRIPTVNPQSSEDLYAKDILPGKNTATLTLASGKVIQLDTNRTSVVVADSVATNTILTARTPRGGTYAFTLPDGTKVWLNADSRIEFPSQFIAKERKILLAAGEAYFEVAKDKLKPFIVESKGQRVEVLGTHFNINAYPDEGDTRTTLLEGSVKVNGKMLVPNQQAVLTKDLIKVKDVNAKEAIAWKNGLFIFENENIKSVMRKVARWYNVDVEYHGNVENKGIGGMVSRFDNLSKLLEMLRLTKEVDCRLEGRTVIISPYKR